MWKGSKDKTEIGLTSGGEVGSGEAHIPQGVVTIDRASSGGLVHRGHQDDTVGRNILEEGDQASGGRGGAVRVKRLWPGGRDTPIITLVDSVRM